MQPTPTPLLFFLFALACFLTGFSKAGFGGSLGFIVTPLLTLVLPLQMVVGLMLPVLMVGDVFAMIANWRCWNVRLFWPMLAGGLLGIGIGVFMLANASPDLMRQMLAVFVWIFVAYKLLEKRFLRALHYKLQNWHPPLAGGIAGFASAMFNAGATPIAAFFLLIDLPPIEFVGTSVILLTCFNWVKLPLFLANGFINTQLLLPMSALLLLVPLGAWIGKKMVNRINRAVFDNLILSFLVVSSFLLMF